MYTSAQTEYLAEARRAELSMKRVPHLGFLYLAAALKSHGVTCTVWDRTLDAFTPGDIARRTEKVPHVFVGFYADTVTRDAVCQWIRTLRQAAPILPILVGGPNAALPRPYLEAGATFVCMGEGEECIVEMVACLDGRRAPETVLGMAFTANGRIVENPPRRPLENLDGLAFPDRDAIDMRRHYDWRVLNMRQPYTTMITSRGCHRRCTFCSVPQVAGSHVRVRSPGNVLAEIDLLVRDHGVRYITFKDDYFAHDPAWEEAFCEGLIRRRYDLLWTCQTHPFVFRKDREARLARFREAGCDLLIFELQSVDADVLRRIKRSPGEPAVVRENVRAAREAGIQTVVEFIFGLPGDREDTLRRAVEYALAVRPRYATFYPLMRLEPSELFDDHGPTGDVCGLSIEEINRWCAWAYRRFYADPRVLVPTALYVLRHNPLWLRHGVRFLGRLLLADAVGRARRAGVTASAKRGGLPRPGD